jgi:hypothetical protein
MAEPFTNPLQGKSFLEILRDPGTQNLLAGIGAKLDPTGVGGALGTTTVGYNQSRVAAQRAEEQEKKRNEQMTMLTRVLGTMSGDNQTGNVITPKGQPGVTSIQAKPDGSLSINADVAPTTMPGTQVPTTATPAGQPQAVVAPQVAPVSAAGTNVLNAGTAEAPQTLEGVTVTANREPPAAPAPAPIVTAANVPDPYARTTRPFDIRSVLPFS